MWLIVVIVVVGFIIAASISSNSDAIKKAQEKEEFSTSANERGKAYALYLRRTSSDSRIVSMTDVELYDFVTSNIRGYKKDCDERDMVGAFIFFGGCIAAIFIVASEGWNWVGFIFLCVLSGFGCAAYIQNQNKELLKKYCNLHLEIEQLEVK